MFRKFSRDGPFELRLSVTVTYLQRFFVGKTKGASVVAVGCHSLVHVVGQNIKCTGATVL